MGDAVAMATSIQGVTGGGGGGAFYFSFSPFWEGENAHFFFHLITSNISVNRVGFGTRKLPSFWGQKSAVWGQKVGFEVLGQTQWKSPKWSPDFPNLGTQRPHKTSKGAIENSEAP